MEWRKYLQWLPFVKEGGPVVGVLRLSGVIGGVGPLSRSGLSLAQLAGNIEALFKLPRLKAVALIVNSPGGSPVQSALIATRIRELAEEKELPVIAFCEDAAASGGYWLACAADEIYADDSSIIGSIGVIAAGFGFPQLIKRLGIERRVHTSGEKKSILDPFETEKEEDVERLMELQKDIHDSFNAFVLGRRGDKLKAEPEALFTGEFWTGKRALELGLIDGIGHLRPEMRRRYGEEVDLRLVETEKGLRRLLRFGSRAPSLDGGAMADALMASLEERAHWSRFGL